MWFVSNFGLHSKKNSNVENLQKLCRPMQLILSEKTKQCKKTKKMIVVNSNVSLYMLFWTREVTFINKL